MIKPKTSMERKVLDKNAAAANAAQKASSTKNHAPPPPALVLEPGDDGERYSTGAFLGKGGFAICYEGTLLRNGRVFAMKVVRSEMTQKKMAEKVLYELRVKPRYIADLLPSSGPSSRYTRRCAIPTLSAFTGLSLLANAFT
jgi:hypothetical protein